MANNHGLQQHLHRSTREGWLVYLNVFTERGFAMQTERPLEQLAEFLRVVAAFFSAKIHVPRHALAA